MAACAVAAYRTELFFAAALDDPDLPVKICTHLEDNDEYRGDRICNNAVGAAVTTIIIAVMLMIIDMIVPCVSAGFVRLSTMFTILWSVLMAAHWLVTGALLSDLYRRYCNNKGDDGGEGDEDDECNDDDRRFTVLIVMSFVAAGGWVSVLVCVCVYTYSSNYYCLHTHVAMSPFNKYFETTQFY